MPPEGQEKAVPDAGTVEELQDILANRTPLFRDTVRAAAGHTPEESR